MDESHKLVIDRWHDVVNSGQPSQTEAVVSDPIVVLGPRGAGSISPLEFADWVARSGIKLKIRSWHPISDRLVVVEQDAKWPASDTPNRVATVFRITDDKVSAALRLPDLKSALELATIYCEMVATE